MFDKIHSATHPVLLAFTASWCAPCKAMHPFLDELTKEYDGHVSVLPVDTASAGGLVQTFQVTSVPSYILLYQGTEHGRVLGAKREELRLLFEQGKKLLP